MSPAELVAEVQTLKKRGYSIRRIAKRLETSHGTVSRILKGYVPGEKAAELKQVLKERAASESLLQERLPRPINPNSEKDTNHGGRVKYVRCGGCGGMVQSGVPCLACETKKIMADSFSCWMNDLLAPEICYPCRS